MTVTVRDVAKHAGVSQATAARALGGYGYVGDDARQRVHSAARALGYLPNNAARTLASGTSNIIGLIAGDIENSFFATAARGLADVVEEFGYTLIVANSDENVDRERRAVDSLRANRVDGLVVAPASSNDGDHLAEAAAAGTPIVLLDRTVRGLGVDSAVSDGLGGATAAVRLLLAEGHRRIGIVIDAAEVPLTSMTMRLRGWAGALRGAGIEADDSLLVYASSPMEDGYKATMELLGRVHPPTAIFTASNFMTIGALRAFRELNIVVPRDLSLVAFDDFELLSLYEPPVTAVAQPVRQLGREAGKLLLARMQGDLGKPRRLRLATELIVRASSQVLGERSAPRRQRALR
ncbi:MAG: LacI family DNA-binding transcriptional regulator [Acidimicrobiales bacterium]|jgi:LacI family transcriptional regulator